MTTMSEEARKARNAYFKQLRDKNREAYNQRQRDWAKRNPEKIKQKNIKYWETVAKKMQDLA